jgi:hypothetical protein
LAGVAPQLLQDPNYFKGETLPKRAAGELVLAGQEREHGPVALPDSGDMATIVAPDLSNLPPGQQAVHPSQPEDDAS